MLSDVTTRDLSPEDLQHLKLGRLRGYDRAAIDELFERLAASYEHVCQEREALRSRVEEIETELAEYRQLKHRLSKTLIVADRAAEGLRSDAHIRAEVILEAARTEAQEIVADAHREQGRARAEVERLRALETEIHAGYRAFLLTAFELLDKDEANVVQPTNGPRAS